MRVLRRKQISVLLCVFLSLGQALPALAAEVSASGDASPSIANDATTSAAPGEIIVKFKKDAINLSSRSGLVTAAKLGRDNGLIESETANDQNLALFVARNPANIEATLAELRSDPSVERAEPNYRVKLAQFPSNDPLGDQLWGLHNIGQTVNGVVSASGSDINAPEAWAINEGTHAQVIVAVIDSGVKINHEDLQNSLWDGTNCVDDSGNPLGGCQHGYDFTDGDPDPTPTSSNSADFHGTHVAGTIAAEKNNGKGIAGVAPHAKIMALRVSEPGAPGFLSIFSIIRAVNFARHNGAKVINASFGGTFFITDEFDAFKAFTDNGGLVAAAAGNAASSNDNLPFYPASFHLPNIISVAATTQNDSLAFFSNTGPTTVHVGAPGVNIKSTYIMNSFTQEVFSEIFDSTPVHDVPAGWLRSGTMGVAVSPHFPTKGLAGDAFSTPYKKNGSGSAMLPAMNLSGVDKELFFSATCDTQFEIAYTDYMRIDVSTGGAFTELARFDEFDLYHGVLNNDGTPRNVTVHLPPSVLTNATVFRFLWVTNGDNDTGTNGEGCFIDDLRILGLASNDTYEFLQGTSMASPHVAGAAALLMGYNPGLTTTDVNNIILSTGDVRDALVGKTVTGKRINLANAMRRADLIAPVITMLGTTPVSVSQGQSYTDAGATAHDDLDGDITGRIITTNPVDTNVVGSYSVRYNVTDAAGNAATEAVRTVEVTAPTPDTVPPVITILGDNPLTLAKDQAFTDPGATASDDRDGDLTSHIVVTGSVDTHTPGTYTLTYSVSDAAGNPASAERSVMVVELPDTTPPVITLLGSAEMTLTQGSSFTDPGATATDDRDGDLTSHIVVTGSVDTNTPGEYILHYNVSDAAENHATEVTRTVTVVTVALPPGEPPSSPARAQQESQGNEQGNGGSRGNNSTVIIHAVAMLQRLHDPESVFNVDAPTPNQTKFLCAIQHMMEEKMNQSLLDLVSAEIEHVTGIPQLGAETFLADPHTCDAEKLARSGKAMVGQAPLPVVFPVGEDGYPVSSNPTWNACIRDKVLGDVAIIRANPDRDPRTGRGYSCDHYSHARFAWHQPDLNMDFTLIPGNSGRNPILSIPHGYIAMSTTNQQVAIATKELTQSSGSDGGSTAPTKQTAANDALTDIRTAEEERRIHRNALSIDGVVVRNIRQTEMQ